MRHPMLGSGVRADLIGRRTVRAAGSCCAFPKQVPHVGDVVLGYRRRKHCRALLVAGGACAEGFDGRLRLPALEDVDPVGVDQVGGDGEIEAVRCPACLFDDAHAAREVGLALLGLDGDVSCDDDDGWLLSLRRRVKQIGAR